MSQTRVHGWLASVSTLTRTVAATWGRVSDNIATRVSPDVTRTFQKLRDRAHGARVMQSRPLWTRQQLLTLGLVLIWVASTPIVRYSFGADEAAATLLFYSLAVAFGAWRGGWTSGLVATFASLATLRLFDAPSGWTMGLFAAECLLLAGFVTTMRGRLQDRSLTLDAANRRLGELQCADARSRSLDVAVRSLEAQLSEFGVMLLDRQGTIVDWRAGAEALYRVRTEAVRGRPASILFQDGQSDPLFRSLLAEAQRGNVVRTSAWQRRGDGTFFEANLELAMTTNAGGDGFAMVVHDRTHEQQRQLDASAAVDAQRVLRDEADVAQRQLAALQAVTDPSLSAWSPSDLVLELLQRVREEVRADGIALVLQSDTDVPHVVSAPDGLQPEGRSGRPLSPRSASAGARIVMVQNDRARVAEQRLMNWPGDPASLLSIPVVYAGRVEGTIEVVNCKGRRSTEWEIALLQVVAARVGGLTHDPNARNNSHPVAQSIPALELRLNTEPGELTRLELDDEAEDGPVAVRTTFPKPQAEL